jgi:hypothetical protein
LSFGEYDPRAYCETTTIHGFSYWVTASRLLEKLFWMSVVLTGFICASLIINTAVDDWTKNPGIVTIKTFSKVSVVKFTKHNSVFTSSIRNSESSYCNLGIIRAFGRKGLILGWIWTIHRVPKIGSTSDFF